MKTEPLIGMSEGQNLLAVLKKSRYTETDIKKLFEGNTLDRLLPVIRGNADVVVLRHVIDTNPFPSTLRDSAIVDEHNGHGEIEWNSEKFSLLPIDGRLTAYYKLNGQNIALNASVLDYFLKHPTLISHKVEKGRGGASEKIFFLGTTYLVLEGHPAVRYLQFRWGSWKPGFIISGYELLHSSAPAPKELVPKAIC